MSRDDFESERYRVERVIDILEHAATRLDAGDGIPLSLMNDAVAFINRSEAAAYEAMLDEDEPALSQCLEQHTAVSRPLAVMQDALAAFANGEKGSAGRFARAVAAYVQLRREHLAADDRLFARASRPVAAVEPRMPIELAEDDDTRRLYDRVVDAGALLDMGVSTAFPVRSSIPRSAVRHPALFILALAGAIVASAAAPARADVCVTIDEARDTFSASDRSAALLLLKHQFELAGEHVAEPGCQQAYVISHVTFGSRIMITLSGPKGQRDATAMGMDDVPAVYSQMVRSLLRGEPMGASGVVDRTNVTATQAASQNRMHSDSVWYARLGYGMYFSDESYGGPAVGFFGYRREGNRYGIDVSFLNFQYKSSDRTSSYPTPQGSSGMTGTWLKLEILRYFAPAADRSPYIGAGLSLSATNLNNNSTYWEGNGLQGELTSGLEMGRAESIHIFLQGNVGLPFYKLRSTTYTDTNVTPYGFQTSVSHKYVPTLTVSLGLGWQKGGAK